MRPCRRAAGGRAGRGQQQALFEPGRARLARGRARWTRWSPSTRISWAGSTADEAPARLRLLAAAESAGALAAAEMGFDGLPWRPDVHDELLAGLLGPRPARGSTAAAAGRARRARSRRRSAAGRSTRTRRPSSCAPSPPTGVPVTSTRSEVLRGVDHPAVPLLLQYKELARLHAAHGWAWLDSWVTDGPVPSGVRGRRGGIGTLGHERRRRAADPAGAAPGGGGRSRLDPGGRRRGATGAAGAGRAGRGPGVRPGGRGRRPVLGAGRGVRRRPGQGQGGAAVRDVRRRGRRSGSAARRAQAAVPRCRQVRGGGRSGRRGGPGGPVGPGPDVPAAVGRLALGSPPAPTGRAPRVRCAPAAGSPGTSSCRPAPRTGRSC